MCYVLLVNLEFYRQLAFLWKLRKGIAETGTNIVIYNDITSLGETNVRLRNKYHQKKWEKKMQKVSQGVLIARSLALKF